jgi:hypothetical protein
MCATLAFASPPRVRRAPALLDARELWVPRFAPSASSARRVAEADTPSIRTGDAWALRGASLAVWRGEVVCVAGSDLAALDALLDCLAGATPAGGAVRARAAWWRAGLLLRPRSSGDACAGEASLTARLCDAVRRRPSDGAVVCALVLPDQPATWDALARVAARVMHAAPVRCVRLAGGRVLPPPRSVDPSHGRS